MPRTRRQNRRRRMSRNRRHGGQTIPKNNSINYPRVEMGDFVPPPPMNSSVVTINAPTVIDTNWNADGLSEEEVAAFIALGEEGGIPNNLSTIPNMNEMESPVAGGRRRRSSRYRK